MTDKWAPRRGADGRWRVLAGITDPQEPGFGGPDTIIIAECFDAEHAALIAAAPELVEALRGLVGDATGMLAAASILFASKPDYARVRQSTQRRIDAARALLDRIEKEANGD